LLLSPLIFAVLSLVYYTIIGVFKRGEEGKEYRLGCLSWIVFLVICCSLGVLASKCESKHQQKHNTHSFISYSHSSNTPEKESKPWSGNRLDKVSIDDLAMDDTVWICTSGSSKRFHSTLACPGMQNCASGADAITREEAEDMGRSHCRRCYTQ